MSDLGGPRFHSGQPMPPIEDEHTYSVLKEMLETIERTLGEHGMSAEALPVPGFAGTLTSLRWRLREWENRQP